MEPLLRFLEPAARPLEADVGRDRYRGTLLGLAVGNALGVPLEGYSAARIRALAPDGVRDVPATEARQPWDDDVAQAIELAECLLAAGGFEQDTYLERLLGWAETSGRGMGRQTREVLTRARAGARGTDAAFEVWVASGRWAAGNGAVMRCAPVALRWRRDPVRLVEDAGHSARVTHYDPRCVWSSVAVCAAIASALAGSSEDLGRLADGLTAVGAPEQVTHAVRECASARLEDLALDESASMGYTIRAMTAGLWAYTHASSFEHALLQVIHAGGDADTNGAVAGAVLGARFGVQSIPERWIERLYRSDVLESLAIRLWQGSNR